MRFNDYSQIVRALFCGFEPDGVILAAWEAGIAPEDVPAWMDCPERFS